jgi:hypothetical protein
MENFTIAPLSYTLLYLAKKTKAERKFLKEEKCRNAVTFQVFLTKRNFLYAEYLTARFSWWSNVLLYSTKELISNYNIKFIKSEEFNKYL